MAKVEGADTGGGTQPPEVDAALSGIFSSLIMKVATDAQQAMMKIYNDKEKDEKEQDRIRKEDGG